MEKGLEHSYRIIPKAQKAGVKFVIGDDFGIGAMPHGEYTHELEAYVKGPGISPLEVITWATKNGYELLGLGKEGGTIEAGKLADLLVVDGNPAKDITILQDRENLDVVMKGGQFVTCQLSPSKVRVQKAA
jgi:imidazolonepropionase-like amidohydrolase